MQRTLTLVLVGALMLTACGGDGATDDGSLTSAERDWCGYTDSIDASAARFDQVFEAGLGLGLPMDQINATAAGLRTEYTAQGMSDDEAIRAVFDDLLGDETYVIACKAAYATYGG